MKAFRISLICAAASLVGMSVASAYTPSHFRGSACILTVNAACASSGWQVGDCTSARYAPPELTGGPTKLSMIWGYYAQNFTYTGGSVVGTAFKQVRITEIGNSASVRGGYMRVVQQSPANPAPATFYSHTGDISHFEPGCNIRYRFTGQKFPVTAPGNAPGSASEEEDLPPFEATGLSNGGAALSYR